MKAFVVIAQRPGAIALGRQSQRGTVMATLLDRPFIRHVIEFLVDQGIHHVDMVFSGPDPGVRSVIHDGTRWGAQFHYHFAESATQAYGMVASLAESESSLLLAHADRLPLADLRSHIESGERTTIYTDANCLSWTGWSILTASDLSALKRCNSREELASRIERLGRSAHVLATTELRVDPEQGLWKAHQDLLAKNLAGVFYTGRKLEPGVWVGRNSAIHPSVKITPPVYVGENTRISAGVKLGPSTVVAHDCLIARRTSIANSVIAPGTYVGRDLELDHVVADVNRIFDLRLEAAVSGLDAALMDGLYNYSWISWAKRLAAKATAAGILGLASIPMAMYTAVHVLSKGRSPWQCEAVIRTPLTDIEGPWKTLKLWSLANGAERHTRQETRDSRLFCHVLPALLSVLKGDLNLIGIRPVSPEELASMPLEERSRYLNHRCGAFGGLGVAPAEVRPLVGTPSHAACMISPAEERVAR